MIYFKIESYEEQLKKEYLQEKKSEEKKYIYNWDFNKIAISLKLCPITIYLPSHDSECNLVGSKGPSV